MFFKIRVLKKYRKFHKKIPVLESLFNEAFFLNAWNFIKETTTQVFSSVKLAKFLRTPFLQNSFFTEHLRWLLLYVDIFEGFQLQFKNLLRLFSEEVAQGCSPVNFAKFLRTRFFYRTPPVAASGFSHFLFLSVSFYQATTHCVLQLVFTKTKKIFSEYFVNYIQGWQ